MVIRAGLIVLAALLAVPAAAQDSPAPVVQSGAPAQPVAPGPDPTPDPAPDPAPGPAAGLPALPAAAAVAETPPAVPATPPPPPLAPAVPATLPEMVLAAHPVVQGVMAALAFAAFAALTVFVHKTAEFALANRRLSRALAALGGPVDLPDVAARLATRRGAGAEMARAALAELSLAQADPALLPGTAERTRATLSRIEAGAAQALRTGTGVLASIGSVAPFVGLFGTVFGIMNSFLAIAETKTTNLAVVAPGIAEALLATAIGLAAAIPAVVFYNLFSRRLARHRHRLGDLATGLEVLQSRALDRMAARAAGGGLTMAFASGQGDDADEMADINVTPFIDVMLVLLIVFMVAAPLSTVDVPVTLPGSSAPPAERPQDPLWLTLAGDGTLFLHSQPVAAEGLLAALDASTAGQRDTAVFLRADHSIAYGRLMTVLDALRDGGYLRVALVGLDGGGVP